MNTAFYSLHPAVAFFFFVMVLAFAILCMHPVYAGVSLVAAILFGLHTRGGHLKRTLRFAVPIFVLIALLNPLFNHRGDTVLFDAFGNGITLEAVQYGVTSAAMFAAVVMWFGCYSAIMTSDKFLYLFGRLAPSGALVVSMAIRMVPKMQRQMETVARVQRMLDTGNGAPVLRRIRIGLRRLSVLLNWTMEDAIETADSMKARGYGMHRGRTSFDLFRVDRRDKVVLGLSAVGVVALWVLYFRGFATLYFYPVIRPIRRDAVSLGGYILYAVLLLSPTLLEWKEDLLWRRLRSSI